MNFRIPAPTATALIVFSALMPLAAAVAAPPRPGLPPPPGSQLTGSGASYMRAFIGAVRNPRSAHVRISAVMTRQPVHQKAVRRSLTADVAWIDPSHYSSNITGVGGVAILVSTGSTLYEYMPQRKLAYRLPASQIPRGFFLIRAQVNTLLPAPLPRWDYHGTRSIGGHPCDYVQAKDKGAEENVYLDRSTHLPRRVYVTQNVPEGTSVFDASFTLFEVNRPVSSSYFRFTPPHGIKVTAPPAPPVPPAVPQPGVPSPRRR